ncbi:hypothetical protein ACQPZZ_37625 [Microbispora sp. CA-135349]|uniref:hypothetical protein n=1 Tax=Microbispora sp. CA-135349 TaxID=3239953 RepID=UPI003D932DD8
MTKYAGRRGVVAGEVTAISLAIAKRLVEGGAQALVTARTPQERLRLSGELGCAARVVAPAALDAHPGPDGEVDLLFADSVLIARPLLLRLKTAARWCSPPQPPRPSPCTRSPRNRRRTPHRGQPGDRRHHVPEKDSETPDEYRT